jgi:hypothetical protein
VASPGGAEGECCRLQEGGRSSLAGCRGPSGAPNVHTSGNGESTQIRHSRVPRPVTIRQLCTAVRSASTESTATVRNGEDLVTASSSDQPVDETCRKQSKGPFSKTHDAKQLVEHCVTAAGEGTALRIGESTLLLDGVACHTVVVCGRVVRRETAVPLRLVPPRSYSASAASRSALACNVFWITDSTGLLCTLQPCSRFTQQRCYMVGGDVGSSCADDVIESSGIPAAQRPDSGCCTSLRGCCAGHPGGTHDFRLLTTRDAPPVVGVEGLWESRATADNINVEDGTKDGYVDEAGEEEEPVCVGDYVVCTGVLAFADVDLAVASVLSRDADTLRGATDAAASFTVTRRSDKGTPLPGDASFACCTTEREAVPQQAERIYVLLPGSGAPLRLDAAQAELGLVGPLPPQTRYLTEHDALQWESHPPLTGGNANDEGQSSTVAGARLTDSRDMGDAACGSVCVDAGQPLHCGVRGPCTAPPTTSSSCSVSSSCPLFCIKGRPRRVADTNECLYWWLSATETHLRLRAAERK